MALKNEPLAAAIQDFINFLRAQKGAYTDACAGYRRNEISIKRQAPRVLKQVGRKIGHKGIPSVIHSSVEDPSAPDVIVQTTRLTREYLEENGRSGSNEQQICRAIIVFIFTYWDDVTRHGCAQALGVEKNDVGLPIAGDLRLLRHAILHDRQILSASAHKRLEVIGKHFDAGSEIVFTHAKMHEIFRLLDKHVAEFALEKLEIPPPPGGWADVRTIAIGKPKAP